MEMRPPGPGELRRFLQASEWPFHDELLATDLEADLELVDPARCLWALNGEAVAGTTGSFLLELTVPGGRTVPTAGVTWSASCRRTAGAAS